MKIISCTEYTKPFVYLSLPGTLRQLGRWMNCPVEIKDYRLWNSRQIDRDSSNDIIVMVEGAYLDFCRMPVNELRTYFPNGKIILACSDTKYYQVKNKFQVQHPADCDLWLDTMSSCAEKYKQDFGIKTDIWYWSINQEQIDYLTMYKTHLSREKEYDVISVISPHTIEKPGSYRKRMVDYIRNSGLSFQLGGNGQEDNNVNALYDRYLNSKINLESSSHDNEVEMVQSMKGFRLCTGIYLDVLSIGDNFGDFVTMCGGTVPIYPYGDFPLLTKLIRDLINSPVVYQSLLKKQQDHFKTLTIEKQLWRLLQKHEIIPKQEKQPWI